MKDSLKRKLHQQTKYLILIDPSFTTGVSVSGDVQMSSTGTLARSLFDVD